MEADETLRTMPHALTDADIATLDAYHGNAKQARRARDMALAARATVAPPRPAAAVVVARTPNVADLLTDGEFDDEKFLKWADAHQREATPLSLWATFAAAIRKRVGALEKEIDTLKAENVNLRELSIVQDLHMKSLQETATTRGPKWCGEHESGRQYSAGELVRRRGTIWVCTKGTAAAPGLSPDAWEVFVRGVEAHP
jgi:hypothetical protein